MAAGFAPNQLTVAGGGSGEEEQIEDLTSGLWELFGFNAPGINSLLGGGIDFPPPCFAPFFWGVFLVCFVLLMKRSVEHARTDYLLKRRFLVTVQQRLKPP